MRTVALTIAAYCMALLLLDLFEYVEATERRLRALERESNVIRGPWKENDIGTS
jgi:hypothetical protein